MSYAYAVSNKCRGLAASAFIWSAGLNDATRSRLNDSKMAALYVNGAAVASLTYLVIDFGIATQLSGIALLNHNAAVQKADAAVQITAADDAAITVNVVSVKAGTTLNNAAPYNKDHVLQFTPVTKRYWKLLFAWTGTVTNFAIGEIFAFNGQTQFTRKSIYGGGESPEMKVAAVDFYNGGGNAYFEGGEIRVKRLPFSDLTLVQREEQMTLWRAVKGPVAPFLWIESFEATALAAAVAEQEVIYGRLMVDTFAWTEADYQLFGGPDLIVRSLGREIGA